MVLHGHELRPAVPLGGVLHLGELPGVHRTGPDVADLARLDQVVQRLHRLLDRGVRVEAVDLVEVDVVGAQAPQAVVDLGHHRLAGESGAVGPGAHPAVHLGREHDVVAAGEIGQCLADDLLAGAVGVHVGGVEEGDAGLQRLPDQRTRGRLVEGPLVRAPVGHAVGHAAQADPRHVQTRRTELHVLHRCRSRLRRSPLPGRAYVFARARPRPGQRRWTRSRARSQPNSGRPPLCAASPVFPACGSPKRTPIPRSRARLSR